MSLAWPAAVQLLVFFNFDFYIFATTHRLSWEPLCESNVSFISVLRVASGPRVK